MEPNELRIGNLVALINMANNELIAYEQVTGLNGNKIKTETVGKFLATLDILNPNKLMPISLTEEILIKCGFEKIIPVNRSEPFFSFKRKQREFLSKPSIDIYTNRTTIGNNTHVNHVKYIHQLQNLYFAITGEELNVKL